MSIRRLSLLTFALTGMGLCALATADDDHRQPMPREIQPLVLNEASARFIERAAQLDANDDGIIDATELANAGKHQRKEKRQHEHAEHEPRHARHLDKRLARLDSDGDGIVTSVEFVAAQDARLARLDTDGDGIVSAQEFRDAGRHGKRERRGSHPTHDTDAGTR